MNEPRFGLLIDPARGMAGDMFSAALLSLGVPPDVLIGAMETAARRLGRVSIRPERMPADGAVAVRLHIDLEPEQPQLPGDQACRYLEETVAEVGLERPFAVFACRALDVLIAAERKVHGGGSLSLQHEAIHREMHRRGVAHVHGDEGAVLHEAQDILIDVVGAAVGLQHLNVALDRVVCLSPVYVGGGFVTFSHGRLPVPAPATRAILERFRVPYAFGPVEKELFTPTGAALLAALAPRFRPREGSIPSLVRVGIGRGLRRMEPPGDLRLGLLTLKV